MADAPNTGHAPVLMSDYDYDLPPELIAQQPVEPRDASRLMVLKRHTGQITHRIFRDIGEFLNPGDLLVINDTRVLPARLRGGRPTGGAVEILLLRRMESGLWEALAKPGKRLRSGSRVRLRLSDGQESLSEATVESRLDDGRFAVRLPMEVEGRLDAFGEMPLPPYIHQRLTDPERYQTVYSASLGSAAAPTAGLHFTPELLASLREHGVKVRTVTLHVGLGTFLPVKVEDARQHQMHSEWYHVPADTLSAIRIAKDSGHRVIAVGTTSCRTLESIADNLEANEDISGSTDLYIMPGFQFRVVDALITNFHLPRSTLLLLVGAFAGHDRLLHAYAEAARLKYRFFSFGDGMLIL